MFPQTVVRGLTARSAGYNPVAAPAMIRFPAGATSAPFISIPSTPMFRCTLRRAPALLVIALASGCQSSDEPLVEVRAEGPAASQPAAVIQASADDTAARSRTPNEVGRIPVLEYHLIGDPDGRWQRSPASFRRDLEILYERGYRPVSVAEMVDGRIDLPYGLSPVVFTFDDASPGQFRYVERNGVLEIDSTSAVGIWLAFAKSRPDWRNRAVFCTLSGAEAGRSFFGNKDIEGQRDAWRLPKVRFLIEQGFELCNHTLWHARLDKYSDEQVQEQIARGVMAIDSAVPGYKVRSFALPLGIWPKNRALAKRGSWTEPRTGRTVSYDFDAILEVAGGPTVSPHDPRFDPLSIERTQVYANELTTILDRLDRNGQRYVSDGNPSTVARPATMVALKR